MGTNSFTDYLELKVLDHVFGATTYTAPATYWMAAHLSTQLAATVQSGATSITTVNAIPDGSSFTVDILSAIAETRVCTSSTGVGPFTINFAVPLLNGHIGPDTVLGVPGASQVSFDPGDAAALDIIEPVGNNYGRASITNNTTNFRSFSGGLLSASLSGASLTTLNVTISFPPAIGGAWGWQTHLVLFDASTSGNALVVAPQITPQFVANGQTLTIPFAALNGSGYIITLD